MQITRGKGDLLPVEIDCKFDSLRDIEVAASEILLEHVRTNGAVAGHREPVSRHGLPEDYSLRTTLAKGLSSDLCFGGWNDADECIVEAIDDDHEMVTKVFNLRKRQGVERRKPRFSVDLPELSRYYDFDEDSFFQHFGDRLLQEILQPGLRPELTDLAEASKEALIGKGEFPLSVIQVKENIQRPTALLGKLTVAHVAGLLEIYQSVAYPFGGERQDVWPARVHGLPLTESVFKAITLTANSPVNQIELRSGVYYLPNDGVQTFMMHTYHQSLDRKNTIETTMRVNGDVPCLAGMRLAFPGDIAMKQEYEKQAAEFFQAEGIAATETS